LRSWKESVGGVAGEKGTAQEEGDDDEGLDEGSGAHGWDEIGTRCVLGCNEGEV